MKVKVSSDYRNINAVKEAIEAISISISIRNKILGEIEQCLAINLQVDELTDITNKILTMNVRYFIEGHAKSRFLGLIELNKSDSQTLYEQLSGTLKSFENLQ